MPIEVEKISHIYLKGTPFERMALKNISLTIEENKIIGIMGKTGSGKSTLLQMLNGLLIPSSGKVRVDGQDIGTLARRELVKLRRKIGLVLQYPERQIFELTVSNEVAYGPKNLGLDRMEIEDRVQEALNIVGLPYNVFKERHTNSLSSGEKRRLAIAGILALKPRYLLLDEPTAGLDHDGRVGLLHHLVSLNRNNGITVIMVSHDPGYLLEICDEIYIVHDGCLHLKYDYTNLFDYHGAISNLGFTLPAFRELIYQLQQKGWEIPGEVRNRQEGMKQLAVYLKT